MKELLEKYCKNALYAHEFKYGTIFIFKLRKDGCVDWIDITNKSINHTFKSIHKLDMFLQSLS